MKGVLTGHQEKALHFTTHVSVTANAGAGKTTVLVRRFVEILLRTRERVTSLAAITFTENAAGELRKRIADLIESTIAGPASDEDRRLLERARDELSSAKVGTIHSFCAQLLREYPVEAGVDAAFTVLEGVDRELLLADSLRETVESLLSRPDAPHERDEFAFALRLIGRKKAIRFLEEWLEKRELIDRISGPQGPLGEHLTDEEILERREKLVGEEIARALNEPSWRQAFGRLLERAGGKQKEAVSALFAEWDRLPDEKAKIRWYREFSAAAFTAEGAPRKSWTGKEFARSGATTDDLETVTAVWEALSGILGAGEGDNHHENDRRALRCVRILLKIYRSTLELFGERKAESGQLDFDDLLVRARDLLKSEEIRRQVAETLKYIMIDEYQDTDHLQYEIVRLLVSDFTTGNLFIVGDPKQSIFSFRNAEVRIFEETRRAIEAAEGSADHSISLAESFRLLTGPVDFVNRVFSKTMGEGSSAFDVPHHELIRGRENPADGKIELLLIRPPLGDEPVQSGTVVECRMVARRIAELISGKHTVFERGSEAPRPARFSDIAVLLRGRTRLEELEAALDELRIPYILSGGIGFYQTQEVLDLLSFFRFLLNPDDDVALAALLRSPFFAIPDSLLFALSKVRRASLWEKLRNYPERGHDRALSRALRILEEDLAAASRLPIPVVVERIMLQTGWHGIMSRESSGSQQVANVRKLLRIAREFEGRGFHSLFDFVERLTMLAGHEPREGQALPEEAENSVRVMTVHAAKGLEFPIVFLPFLDQRLVYDDPPYVDAGLGITFEITDTSDESPEGGSPYFELMKRRSHLKTEAEEKRIFYVACTRARDMLALSGRVAGRSSGPSYLDWSLKGLGLDPAPLPDGDIVLPEAPLTIVGRANALGATDVIQHRLKISATTLSGVPETPPLAAAEQTLKGSDQGGWPELWVEPVQGGSRGEVFTATQIRTFLECPTKYYLKYILGLPETNRAPFRPAEDEDEPDETGGGEVEGSITHLVLRDLKSPSVGDREVEEMVGGFVSGAFPVDTQERERRIRAISKNVLNFIRSEFGSEVLSAAETLTEHSISAAFEDDFLTGTIDRLCRGRRGEWFLVDYKTDRISAEELEARSALYQPQLALYAWMVRRLYSQDDVRASIVFLDHPSRPVHFMFGRAEAKKFEVILSDSIRRIKSRNFERTAPVCKTCSYQTGSDCLVRFGAPAQFPS